MLLSTVKHFHRSHTVARISNNFIPPLISPHSTPPQHELGPIQVDLVPIPVKATLSTHRPQLPRGNPAGTTFRTHTGRLDFIRVRDNFGPCLANCPVVRPMAIVSQRDGLFSRRGDNCSWVCLFF